MKFDPIECDLECDKKIIHLLVAMLELLYVVIYW